MPLFNDTGEWRAFEARSGNSLVGKVAELPLLDVFNDPFLTAPDLEQALGRIKKRVPDRVSYDESPMRVSEWRAGTTVFATTREEDMAMVRSQATAESWKRPNCLPTYSVPECVFSCF